MNTEKTTREHVRILKHDDLFDTSTFDKARKFAREGGIVVVNFNQSQLDNPGVAGRICKDVGFEMQLGT